MVFRFFTGRAYSRRLKNSSGWSMALKQKKVTIDSMPKYSTSTMPNLSKFRKAQNGTNATSEAAVKGEGLNDKKLIHRSSVICSEGFDKYTFDCHHNDIPVRSMGLELDGELAMGSKNDSVIPTNNMDIFPESLQKHKASVQSAYETVAEEEDEFTGSSIFTEGRTGYSEKSVLFKRGSVVNPKKYSEREEPPLHRDPISYSQVLKPQAKSSSFLIKRESVVHPKRSDSVFKSPATNKDFSFRSPTLDQKSGRKGILRKPDVLVQQEVVRQKHGSSARLGPLAEHAISNAKSLRSSYVKRDSVVHPGEMDVQHSLYINGRFQNPWPTWHAPTITNILKFGLSKDKSNVASKPELDLILPVVKPNFIKNSKPPEDGIRVTWIGHSTVLVQMHGLNILTDPIFSDRASPSQVVGPKRYRDPPCSIHDLPHIDAVVISHSHYDHLDFNTVRVLNARFDTDIRWFVPSGLLEWMHHMGCDNVVELDWWEENCVPEHSDTYFIFTPAQHWSKRTIGDDNKVLWGSWCIIGPKYRFFFGGDTGYCDVFKQIGQMYGPFDVSAIPIGSYEPRWFMKYSHMNPEEAVKVHIDVNSKYSLAIHWGTFCLGNEYYLDPPMKLRDGLDHLDISPEYFFTFKHGETRLFTQDIPFIREKSVLYGVKK